MLLFIKIGIALKSLLMGIVSIYLYWGYIQKKKIPNDMGSLVYLIPIILIVFLTFAGYFAGFIEDLYNPELGSTLKIIEGFIGIIVLVLFLRFYKGIT